MPESLYTSQDIVLFGRWVDDLAVGEEGAGDTLKKSDKGQFARIYGVSYDGVYVEMPAPVLFLVPPKSTKASDAAVPGPNPRDKAFFDSLRAWTVSKTDKTVRMDLDQGKFEDLVVELGGDGVSGISGARVSGARVSGARVSGARVSGARISGARGAASD